MLLNSSPRSKPGLKVAPIGVVIFPAALIFSAALSTSSQVVGTAMPRSPRTSLRYIRCWAFTSIATAMILPSIRMSWFADKVCPYLATRASSGRRLAALSNGTSVPLETPPSW